MLRGIKTYNRPASTLLSVQASVQNKLLENKPCMMHLKPSYVTMAEEGMKDP
jgi:hypothetical protein